MTGFRRNDGKWNEDGKWVLDDDFEPYPFAENEDISVTRMVLGFIGFGMLAYLYLVIG